jgi:DNA-binding NtrC family response regulator/tetratricopeptide (TPR) repeat protein
LSTRVGGSKIRAVDPLLQLLGESPGIAGVREQVTRLLQRQSDARRMAPVLIQGETGTGKGLLARALHAGSARARGPFVDVNCAAIPETLLESEMFGVERGAFTDARQAKAGLFQTAHRGTIFLDEIALLPEALQAKLLKALEEREVRRVGATRSEAVDVWVLAATNEDLAAAVQARRFRTDLYHRLAVVTLSLPPLRERGGDAVLLAEHFLAQTCADYGMPARRFTPAARAALRAYPWPGNIRELSNVIERVALLSDAPEVTAEALGLPAAVAVAPAAAPARTLEAAVGDVEREHLLRALEDTGWNISRAALRLGISRNTLRYRMEKHALEPGSARRRPASGRPAAAPAPPAPPAPEPAPRRERRRLALLRAALTAPDGEAGPGVERRVLELFRDKGQSFGGRIEELNASGMVAAFGLEPVEDAPVRAAHAALAILNALERARRAEGLDATVRMAVHVEHVMVAVTPQGPAVDLEFRPHAWAYLEALLDSAGPDGIVVSEAAAPFFERRFDLTPASGGRVGMAWRLAGREGLAPRARLGTFVGRRQELDLLRSRFEAAARGQGQLIGITGDPGIGKSRLLWEFRQAPDAGAVTWLEGRCLSHGAGVPYLPVLDVLRSLCGIGEADTPEAMGARVRTALADLGADAGAVPCILHLLGLEDGTGVLDTLDPEEARSRLFEAVRGVLLRESRRRPLVLVFEDLHWIDATSEQFLTSLADAVPGARLLLVATYRAGYRPPWSDRSYATQIALPPLAAPDAHSLLRAVLGTRLAGAEVVDVILAKAEGNPFFLEELARGVREQGGGAVAEVPDTVQQVLLVRLERLPDEERRLLRIASVVGKDVPRAVLEAVAPLAGDALRRALRRLRDAEFLRDTGLVPDEEFTFKHALTHEVTYESLADDERRALHAALGEALERLYPDRLAEHVERLAGHAFEAGAWEKAAGYLRQAGVKAFARGAHREAVTAFERALIALGHLRQTRQRMEQALELRFDLRNSLQPLGDLTRILDDLREAEALAVALDDQPRLGRVLGYLTDYFRLMGDPDRAMAYGERARALAGAVGDFVLEVAANTYLGQVLHDRGDYQRAVPLFRQNVEALAGERAHDRLGLPQLPSVHQRTCLAWCLAELGEFPEALARAEEAVSIAESVDQPLSRIVAYSGLGAVHLRRWEPAAAVAALAPALELADAWSVRLWFPRIASALGLAQARTGGAAEAVPLLEGAVEQAGAMRLAGGQAALVTALAEAYLRAGRLTEAGAQARRGLELARAHGERGYEGWTLNLLGEVAEQAEPGGKAAAQRYGEAIALAGALAMRPLAAQAHLGRGRAWRRAGEAGRAREALACALALFSAMGVSGGAGAVQAELATLG